MKTVRFTKRLPLKAFGRWRICFTEVHSTLGTASNVIDPITPTDTSDPLGDHSALLYDTSADWANMYNIGEVMKSEITVRVMNQTVSEAFYFWMVVTETSSNPIDVTDQFPALCQEHRLKWMLCPARTTTSTNPRFKTMKYTVYTKEFLKSRGTNNWPNDNSHSLNTTSPTFRPFIHFGITSFDGTVFTATQKIALQIVSVVNIALKKRVTL